MKKKVVMLLTAVATCATLMMACGNTETAAPVEEPAVEAEADAEDGTAAEDATSTEDEAAAEDTTSTEDEAAAEEATGTEDETVAENTEEVAE